MEGGKEMLLAFDRRLTTATGLPVRPEIERNRLNIVVIFTSTAATAAALKKAGNLAESLGAQITLIVPQIVPYPLPLSSPPVLLDFQEKRFRELASESPVDTRVQLYLCRDFMETLKEALSPHSLIVIGGRRRWWPTRETGLARRLKRAGHEVVLAEPFKGER
jgi:hypothetical protein